MTKLVGILNLTPDSFSDGGRAATLPAMRSAVTAIVEAGAVVVDVGAESTRPGAQPISAEEEWARLAPFIEQIWPVVRGVALSVDTRHAATARACGAVANWINDVSGFSNPAMIRAVAATDHMLVVMHSLSVPADPMLTLPPECDPIEVLLEFAQQRTEALMRAGIHKDRIIFDPGLGFGKSAEQSLEIIHRVGELRACGLPLLIGHSRKSFLKLMNADRDAATLSLSRSLIDAGVEYLRIHDVAAHRALFL